MFSGSRYVWGGARHALRRVATQTDDGLLCSVGIGRRAGYDAAVPSLCVRLSVAELAELKKRKVIKGATSLSALVREQLGLQGQGPSDSIIIGEEGEPGLLNSSNDIWRAMNALAEGYDELRVQIGIIARVVAPAEARRHREVRATQKAARAAERAAKPDADRDMAAAGFSR